MDLDMPRSIKGIEVAVAIRDRWPPIEIILTTVFFEEADLTLPARTEFYSKPIQRDQIVAAMHRMNPRVTVGPPIAAATVRGRTTAEHVVARNGENAWIMLVQRAVKAETGG